MYYKIIILDKGNTEHNKQVQQDYQFEEEVGPLSCLLNSSLVALVSALLFFLIKGYGV